MNIRIHSITVPFINKIYHICGEPKWDKNWYKNHIFNNILLYICTKVVFNIYMIWYYDYYILYFGLFKYISHEWRNEFHRTTQRAPEPRPPAQPRPHTRRPHYIAHAKDRRICRHQRPTPWGPTRNIRRTRILHPAEPCCKPQLN